MMKDSMVASQQTSIAVGRSTANTCYYYYYYYYYYRYPTIKLAIIYYPPPSPPVAAAAAVADAYLIHMHFCQHHLRLQSEMEVDQGGGDVSQMSL